MTAAKYAFTAVNIIVFQALLGQFASLTATHQTLALIVTIVDLAIESRSWFSLDNSDSVLLWDTCLHTFLPVALSLTIAYISMKDRLHKDEQVQNEYDDMKKVLGSLSQGVALTVDFPQAFK